jgi:hypothetical protein
MKIRAAAIIPFLAVAPLVAQQFGEPLSLKEPTGIAAIVADPGAFDGDLVQVKGTILDVCPRAGCYVVIGEEGSDSQMMFKVEDGAMVFKPELKGRAITAEGTVALIAPKPEPEVATEDCEDACDGCGGKKPAPKPTARLMGTGALVK